MPFLLKRNSQLLPDGLINEDFLTYLQTITLQIAYNHFRLNNTSILTKCVVATEHVTQVVVLLIDCTPLVAVRYHEDVLRWVRLNLAFELFGQCVHYLLNLLSIAHSDGEFLFLSQHRVAFDKEQALIFRLKLPPTFLSLQRCNCLILSPPARIQILSSCSLLELLVDYEG